MAYKIGIVGLENTGKSRSRIHIPDGENCFIISTSTKALYLNNSTGKPIEKFHILGKQWKDMDEAKDFFGLQHSAPDVYVAKGVQKITRQPGNNPADLIAKKVMQGNFTLVKEISEVSDMLQVVSEFMPHIHTVIIPDFTHFISRKIAQQDFIERKAGGEAYQRFWELAADALRSFMLSIDDLRDDLTVVTEYHAQESELGKVTLFVPAGKMLEEKFRIPSYYDVFLFTDVDIESDLIGAVTKRNYRFVTKATNRYPQARFVDDTIDTFIPSNLFEVLKLTRAALGMKIPEAWLPKPEPKKNAAKPATTTA
jgi:hypothetical protein